MTYKTYKHKASLVNRINQTLLKYVEYKPVMAASGQWSAVFTCLSDRERQLVADLGFEVNSKGTSRA